MSATYHPSVRHYHAPFPLSHRNVRPFASPTSHQGPWGAAHHEELTETSPLSKTFDRRNQSSVPLPSPGSAGRSRQSHKDLRPSQSQRATSPWNTTTDMSTGSGVAPSSPASPLGGSGVRPPLHNGPPDPLALSSSSFLYETLGASSDGGLFSTTRGDERNRRGDAFVPSPEQTLRDAQERRPPPVPQSGAIDHDSERDTDEPTSPMRGRNEGEYSMLKEQRRLADVVPQEYEPPNTLRLATRRVDPVASMSSEGVFAGGHFSSGGAMSPRRRQPPRVPVGYVYKSTSVSGLNAPTHVQIPMGYRVVSDRPQIPAKVTQYSPWKPMDQQQPLPTLEGQQYGDGPSLDRRHQSLAHNPNVKPFSSDDASLRYASKETLQMIAAGVSASPEQHYRSVVATSRLGRAGGGGGVGLNAGSPDLLADYAKAQRTQPPPPYGSPGWEVSPFETSRKTFSRKNSSNVPLSPTRTRRSGGGGEASGSSVASGFEQMQRRQSTADSASAMSPNSPSTELSPSSRRQQQEDPHSSPSSRLAPPRQTNIPIDASTPVDDQHASAGRRGGGGDLGGSGTGDREMSLHEHYASSHLDGNNVPAACWPSEHGRVARGPDDDDRPPQFGFGGNDDADDENAAIRRGRSRASPYAPQVPLVPEGWADAPPYALPQHKAPVDPLAPRRRQPPRVPVGYVYKSTSVSGLNAPTHVQIPMGYRVVSDRPQIPAKVTQYSPWKPMDQQQPLPTLEGQQYGDLSGQRGGGVERIPATPLITEVDERLAAQGLGSLLDICNASDERISNVLKSIGFGPSDRMSILWQLRRRHPSAASS